MGWCMGNSLCAKDMRSLAGVHIVDASSTDKVPQTAHFFVPALSATLRAIIGNFVSCPSSS
jgi:hypothetical protein